MLTYAYLADGRRRVADLDALQINGAPARLLTQPDLYSAMRDLGVPNITANDGRHELLCSLARHLEAAI
jgi:hypothetical protein